MTRFLIALVFLTLLLAAPAAADSIEGRTGIGAQFGINKLVGGDRDYSNADQNFGFWMRHGFSPRWSFEALVNYGTNRPGALMGEDAGWTFDSVHAFYTTMYSGSAGARLHFAPDSAIGPYALGRFGFMNWKVRDENGNTDVGMFPGGPTVSGFDKDGNAVLLEDTNLIATFGLGVEWFISDSFSMDLGGSYTMLFDNKLDNIGTSALWGPDEADVNTGRWDFFAGATFYFGGSRDKDKDGFEDKVDGCPEEAEDVDGFQDNDGCPDPDNDGDGILDADDNCPDEAEDMDGFQDEDGCPDADNDLDGVTDAYDNCPDEAEDMDGFQDEDGCPDPDNDLDGVLDAADNCPETPADVEVDEFGCPIAAAIGATMILEGVGFEFNSTNLTKESFAVLDNVASSMVAYPDVNIEIKGYTDSSGADEVNLEVSQNRANAVREYLAGKGVAPTRMTAVGYGEANPVADNSTREGRAANRRVELERIQ